MDNYESESVVGIFSNLKLKYGNSDLVKHEPILVEVGQKGWMSTYKISWGEIKVNGRSSLSQNELKDELRKEFRRVKDISILFREEFDEREKRRIEEEKRDKEFWEEFFTEDGAFESH